jgi:hypothetical protein
LDDEGSIKDPKVIRSISPTIDAECLRVMRTMPQWTPGKMQNRNVSVQYNLPIKFALSNKWGKSKKKKKKNKA